MNTILEETIKLVPTNPGCYLYYNKDGEIIYVGKAKNLKRRDKKMEIHGLSWNEPLESLVIPFVLLQLLLTICHLQNQFHNICHSQIYYL